ncbi:MAG TPA: hypothetical protein EYG95_02930 [Campylobacterales bacterium]|nr:hypothetical protein [Campylobacterales bacterium]
MKKKITKGFLWSVLIFEVGVLLLVFLLYILSDAQTLKYVVDRATKNLDISYEGISGNFLKTMSIRNIKYKGKLLAKEAEIDWNLRALLNGDIEIETLSLKYVNLANIEAMIKEAQKTSVKDSSSKETSSQLSFPKMSISHLYLSTMPYKNDIIKIDTLELEVYDVSSNLEEISIKEFSLDTHNNHCFIKTDGYIKKGVLHLKNLQLQELDIAKIEQSISLLDNKEESNSSKPFALLQGIYVDNLSAEIKPYNYKQYQISSFYLRANQINASLSKQELNAQNILLDTETNVGTLNLHGKVQKNQFRGTSNLNLSQSYFQKFTNIVDFKSLNPINLTLIADSKKIESNITLKSKQVFAGRYKDYLAAIDNLKTQVTFDVKSKKLIAITDANVSSKYASSLILKDTLTYDGNLSYGGTIAIAKLQHFPEFSLPLFKNALIHYKADSKDLVANLHTDKLHLLYEMFGYKRADFRLTSKELEIVKYFPSIPKELHPLMASLSATMALDFRKLKTIKLDTNITSNALNIRGETFITKGKVLAKTKTSLSKKSFLSKIDKNVKYTNIFPADLEIGYHDKNLELLLVGKNSSLKNKFSYDFNSSIIEDKLTLGSDTITLEGEGKHLKLHTHTYSLRMLQDALFPLYTFEKRPYDGEVEVNATLENFTTFNADINSRWLVYEYKLNKFAFAEKIKIDLLSEDDYLLIENYRFSTYLDYDRTFYASKPSKIRYKDGKFELLSLWVNDGLNTTGGYDINKEEGILYSKANKYRYQGQEGNILFNTNITTTLVKKRTHIEGKVDILEGLITYEHRKTHEISDPDIIIIQDEEARFLRAAEKKNDLSIDISIHSKKPLKYKVPQIEVDITPDIKIWKESQQELEMLGRVIINKGLYIQSDKEFFIQPGEVLFGGKILNPYLNIKAQHTNKPYVIDIDITGTLDSPIINFSSSPYLSQSDILSMLLFSATTESLFEGSTSSSNQAISMLGNTFAKEIVKNFGLTLDKLVLSTTEEGGLGIEIGKKISQKITVIYTNDIVQSIKVRYQHSDNYETNLMISPESSGIDFLYKSEH